MEPVVRGRFILFYDFLFAAEFGKEMVSFVDLISLLGFLAFILGKLTR